MLASCLLMLRFADRQKLVGALDALERVDNIDHWHAVDGYFGLVLHVTEDAKSVAEAVSKIDGFTELARCETGDDLSVLTSLPEDKSHSYLFMEADPELIKTICIKLSLLDSVTHCFSATGDYNIAAIISGDSFDEIDRTIKQTITPLDGILRLRQNRIIGLSSF